MAAHLCMDVEECPKLVTDLLKLACLVPVGGLDGVAVHGVADPEHVAALALHRADQGGQVFAQLLGTHAHNDGHFPGDVVGVQHVQQVQQLRLSALVGDFHAQRITNALEELQVGTAELSGPLAHPQHVSRAVVPVTSGGVLAGEGLLVRQKQALVGSVEVGLRKRRRRRVNANGLKEAQALVHFGGQLAVLAALWGLLHKVQVPGVQAGDVGIPARGKGAEDVQGLCRLVVALDHEVGVVLAGLRGGVLCVDDITAVAWEFHAVHHLSWRRARLGKLSGHASNLDHRHGATKCQDQGHLQDDTERVPNSVHIELFERLSAVTAHQ
mmetsp:Transcript_20286/g.29335  ORF Transcript_20286/g.29335 Transcript_20286/m.29335 type:complete len:326 (-) Transcript_20286:429-1406(-)